MSSPICLTAEPFCVLIVRSKFDAKHFIEYVLLVWDVSSELHNHISISSKPLNPFRDFFKVVTRINDNVIFTLELPAKNLKERTQLIKLFKRFKPTKHD